MPTSDPPKFLVAAVEAEAISFADRMAAFLDDAGVPRDRPVPLAFALELAACLTLGAWEEAGVSAHLPPGLPAAGDALRELLAHAADRDRLRERLRASPLFGRVLSVRLAAMAWDGPAELGAHVAVRADGLPPDALDRLARLLWKCRGLGRAGARGD
jgi:hypothetical protein